MIERLYCPRGAESVLRVLKWLVMAVLLLAVCAIAAAFVWLQRPLPMALRGQAVADVVIAPGSTARGVARALRQGGVQLPDWWLYGWLRLSGQSREIKAGAYELEQGITPAEVLSKFVRGEQAVRRVTFVEGWNYRQVLQALKAAEFLRYDLPASGDPLALAQALHLNARHPEGRFFPDTYVYPKNSNASDVLKQAAAAMDTQLARAWAQRAHSVNLRSPDEALVLASIVEKETGHTADRTLISAVFNNRLRIGMRLQTDPTVIYGLGQSFDGNLRRRDLEADTPYNTYTRTGLPPTPIAMPGAAALLAAVQPAASPALYFVAKGDGTSHFSQSLDEHNQAVRRYILKR